jgi:hypothetical protein
MSYLVLVKHPKNERCEFAGVALREELLVDFDEAQFRQQAVWTVLEETLVPETHKRAN